eukprot:668685-Pleurochrysis_carterae.AAC.1
MHSSRSFMGVIVDEDAVVLRTTLFFRMHSSRSFMGVMVDDDAVVVRTTLYENAFKSILYGCDGRRGRGC